MSKLPIVMVSGHFDPFHDGHLSYLQQAMGLGYFMVCVVSTDEQLLRKKGQVNIPENSRKEIVDSVLKGLNCPHITILNEWDMKTTLMAEALRRISPDVFFRGGDKTLDTMPPEERQVCEELGIEIRHAEFRIDRHGAKMKL